MAPLLLVAMVLLVVAPAPAQEEGAAELSPREQLLAGLQTLLENEQYKELIAACSELITRSGGADAQAYLKRAEAHMGLENYESAEADLDNAISYGYDKPQLRAAAQEKRGEVYLEQGNIGDALEDLNAVVAEVEPTPNLKFLLGKAQALGGPATATVAVETLTEYLDLEDPKLEDRELEVYRLRAQSYATLRRFDEAKADLDRAIEGDPTDHENYQTKATVLMVQEEYAAAVEAFSKAIENYEPEDPNDTLPPIAVYLARASALEEIGRAATADAEKNAAYAATKSSTEELIALLPDDRPDLVGVVAAAQFQLGKIERFLGDLPAAVKALTAAIDANPQSPPEFLGQAYYRRGICFYYLDEDNLALLDFEAASGSLLDDPRANLWKGRTHAKLNEYLDAIRAYSDAIAVSDRYSDAFIHRGLAYLQLNEYDKSITDFNEAIRLKPTTGDPYYYRGRTYSLQGDRDRAIKSLTNAIRFDPKLVKAYRALSSELLAAGQVNLAGEYSRQADEIQAEQAGGSGEGSGTREAASGTR